MSITVFLGGTCNNSTWRDELIPLLDANVTAFNPVVPDWTEECMAKEIEARENSDIVLYVITPKMTGVYSIAEVVDDSNKRPERTVFAYLQDEAEPTTVTHDNGHTVTRATMFTPGQLKSLKQVAKMVETNGAVALNSLKEVTDYINKIAATRR